MSRMKWKGIVFDDFTVSKDIDDRDCLWTQVCRHCMTELGIPEERVDSNGSGICGVGGCSHGEENDDEETFYLDIPMEEAEFL